MNTDTQFRPRILVAEDDPINLDIASRTLQRLGCDVVAADNGAIATLLLTVEEFDLILMDCEMPQIDGIEATKLVRELEVVRADQRHGKPVRRTPIIAVTAHSSDDIRDKCLAAGMDGFIGKPFTRSQLAQVLQRWVTERDQHPAEDLVVEVRKPPPLMEGQVESVDTAVLTALCSSKDQDGVNYLDRLLGRFAEVARKQLGTMWQQLRDDQPDDLWRVAHTLRSSAGALGATKVASQARAIEHRVREHGLTGLEPALAELETDVEKAIEALSDFAREFNAIPER